MTISYISNTISSTGYFDSDSGTAIEVMSLH